MLKLAIESLPSEMAMVSFFSLDVREFVVVRAAGTAAAARSQNVLLQRASERVGIAQRAMRANQAIVLAEKAADAIGDDPRWQAWGSPLWHLVCAPVQLGGRYLGLIEIANSLDGAPFTEADGNALTYMGQQLAEFLGKRELVFDRERVLAPPLAARIRR